MLTEKTIEAVMDPATQTLAAEVKRLRAELAAAEERLCVALGVGRDRPRGGWKRVPNGVNPHAVETFLAQRNGEPARYTEIMRGTSLTSGGAGMALRSLRAAGRVEQLPDRRYVLVTPKDAA